jgi:S-adenosylmethionine:tRNA ribosyltransferase-isomerase
VHVDDLDYDLPDTSIAQVPIDPRDAARLLVDRGPHEPPVDANVSDLPALLRPDDLVVLNETRVLPARVSIRRDSGGAGEVLLLEPVDPAVVEAAGGTDDDPQWWEALCRPSRKLRVGQRVRAEVGDLEFEIGEELGDGRRLVLPLHDGDLLSALDRSGVAPLPPYIHERLEDAERYQTVFARRAASAAAPTAGLHLTPAVLGALGERGVQIETVELVVGLDTFRPISTDRVEDHAIHSEQYAVPLSTWDAVEDARSEGRRVVAVGTTTVRALESAATLGTLSGRTRLFITPGFNFKAVDVMMTNFHLPRSSLLAMVEAFVGPRWRDLYATALERGYRFLSFGDAMLFERAVVEDSDDLTESGGAA